MNEESPQSIPNKDLKENDLCLLLYEVMTQ